MLGFGTIIYVRMLFLAVFNCEKIMEQNKRKRHFVKQSHFPKQVNIS